MSRLPQHIPPKRLCVGRLLCLRGGVGGASNKESERKRQTDKERDREKERESACAREREREIERDVAHTGVSN